MRSERGGARRQRSGDVWAFLPRTGEESPDPLACRLPGPDPLVPHHISLASPRRVLSSLRTLFLLEKRKPLPINAETPSS